MGEAKRKAAERARWPRAELVRPDGAELTWEQFMTAVPQGSRCGLCGDKIKSEGAIRSISGNGVPVYSHLDCRYCRTCERSWLDCMCERDC